mmetsp:Transcript_5176/g.17282  ORF Transcript_5176/g.17282 Transcript_5176/m.17282 type:complete len:431 (+) Transcript_5176:3423-4715(+)
MRAPARRDGTFRYRSWKIISADHPRRDQPRGGALDHVGEKSARARRARNGGAEFVVLGFHRVGVNLSRRQRLGGHVVILVRLLLGLFFVLDHVRDGPVVVTVALGRVFVRLFDQTVDLRVKRVERFLVLNRFRFRLRRACRTRQQAGLRHRVHATRHVPLVVILEQTSRPRPALRGPKHAARVAQRGLSLRAVSHPRGVFAFPPAIHAVGAWRGRRLPRLALLFRHGERYGVANEHSVLQRQRVFPRSSPWPPGRRGPPGFPHVRGRLGGLGVLGHLGSGQVEVHDRPRSGGRGCVFIQQRQVRVVHAKVEILRDAFRGNRPELLQSSALGLAQDTQRRARGGVAPALLGFDVSLKFTLGFPPHHVVLPLEVHPDVEGFVHELALREETEWQHLFVVVFVPGFRFAERETAIRHTQALHGKVHETMRVRR